MGKGIKCTIDRCIVMTIPEFAESDNGIRFLKFTVKREGEPYIIRCFDDEREKNPFKAIEGLVKRGKFKKGTVLNIDCLLSHYSKNIISDSIWNTLSKDPNPTRVSLPMYKLVSWDFAIPVEYHGKETSAQKEPEKKVPPAPLTDLSIYGGGGVTC